MALTNTNPVKIAGTDLVLNSTFIVGLFATVRVPNPLEKEIDLQLFVYKDFDSWIANPEKNSIKISELLKNNHVVFTHNRSTDGDLDQFIDEKMKARLLEIFSDWDGNLITFIPEHV